MWKYIYPKVYWNAYRLEKCKSREKWNRFILTRTILIELRLRIKRARSIEIIERNYLSRSRNCANDSRLFLFILNNINKCDISSDFWKTFGSRCIPQINYLCFISRFISFEIFKFPHKIMHSIFECRYTSKFPFKKAKF